MSRGGAEREWDTESEAGSRLWAVSAEPDAGLELTRCEIMTWAKVRCLTVWATQVPQSLFIFEKERERERERERRRQRARHRIWSRLQALSCQHGARRGAWTHEPWDHDLSWSRTPNGLSHPGTLRLCSFSLKGSFVVKKSYRRMRS